MTDYLITTEPGEHHSLRVAWNGSHSLLYISSNSRTLGMSPAMAQEMLNALMAVLKGGFDRAISETDLRLETETLARHARIALVPRDTSPRTFTPPPELDAL